MTQKTRNVWASIVHQLPTVAVLSLVFASGGWKGTVDNGINNNCDEIVNLRVANIIQDEKADMLEDRITELEAIARERWLQIQSLQANQSDIREMVRDMHQWMMEDGQ